MQTKLQPGAAMAQHHDGLIEQSAELIEIIDRGGRVREMLRFFARRRDALGYYATRMHFQYDPQSAFEQSCCACMMSPSDHVVDHRWEAVVFTGVRVGWLDLIALLLFKFTIPRLKFDVINFRTFHPFCDRCWREVELNRKFADTINLTAALPLAPGFVLAILGLNLLVFGRPRDHEQGWWMLGVAGALLAVGWGIASAVRWMKLPRELRFIWRKPFRLKSRAVVEDLPAAVLEASAGPQQQFEIEAAMANQSRRRIPLADR